MNAKLENRINAVLAIASVVGMGWLACVIVSSMQYRKEMACADHWDHPYNAEECAKALKEAPAPRSKDARALL
jgi:hypothetical protein